jgi:hypothetical protein
VQIVGVLAERREDKGRQRRRVDAGLRAGGRRRLRLEASLGGVGGDVAERTGRR